MRKNCTFSNILQKTAIFRDFKKSTAMCKVHNVGLRYINSDKHLPRVGHTCLWERGGGANSDEGTDTLVLQRWYAQSESIIIKTHSKTIVLQDYRFYLFVFFLSLLLFTVPKGVKL